MDLFSNTGAVAHLTAVATGNDQQNRTGNSIMSRDLLCEGVVVKNATGVATVLRILVVRDRQQIADTSPSVADILASVDPTDHRNPLTIERFGLLADRMVLLDAAHVLEPLNFKIPLTEMHVRYNGANGTDIQNGGIYVLFLSNEATLTPAVTTHWRFRFYDN